MRLEDRIYNSAPAWAQTFLMNAHGLRIRRHRYGVPFREAVRELAAFEYATAGTIQDYQDERIRSMIAFAYAHSSFYRRQMDELELSPQDIRGSRDIGRLPILAKDTVRSELSSILTRKKPSKDWLHGHTSGTTGSPLSLWYDRRTCVMTNAVDEQQKAWAGVTERDWVGLFLGRLVVPTHQTSGSFWRSNFVRRQVWFSSFHLKPEFLPKYVSEIRRRKLLFLEGYPSTLYILAKHLLAAGQRLPMKAVFSSSETLHEAQREAIQTAFEAPLYDFYGMAERTVFAAECEYHEKHLAETFGYTEIVDATGQPVTDGTVGYVVSTSLHNTAMPLIRYRTNDMSAIEVGPCACGRTARRLRNITTKAEDIVVLPDGRSISPSILTHPFKPYPEIEKSQIVQLSLTQILVKVVAPSEFDETSEAGLMASLRERVGSEVHVELMRVDEIPNEPSGKFRWVISNVPHALKVRWAA